MDDKTQSKHAMFGLVTVLLLVLMIPFALIGTATAPKVTAASVEPNVSPRTAATVLCQAEALKRDPQAVWQKPAEWIMSKHATGNYSLMMYWQSRGKTGMLQGTFSRCVLQPVNGSLQLVSLS